MNQKPEIIKETVYISGPITGYDLSERKLAFLKVQHMLEALGYKAVNPLDNGIPDDAPYHVHMRADLQMLLDCDAIYMMPGWEQSTGAKLELNVATSCGTRLILEAQGGL